MTTSREALLARMEQAGGAGRRKPLVQINRSAGTPGRARAARVAGDEKRTVDASLYFEIFGLDHPQVIADKRKPDDEIVRQLKTEINAAGINRRHLYQFIGPAERGGLFENENQAYNLEYGLRQRPTITMECLDRWLQVLGKRKVVVFENIESGWFGKLLELQKELAEVVRLQRAGQLGGVDWDELAGLVEAAEPDPNGF